MHKIVFIHLLNDFSGSPKVLSQVINKANLLGIETHLYTCKGGEGFLDQVGVKRFYFPYRHFNNKFLTLLSFFTSQLALFLKLLKYRKDSDVVFYINTMLPFGGLLAGKLTGKRVVCHVHETSLKPLFFKKFLRSIIKISATKVIFVSKYLELAEGFKGIDSKVVYNGFDNACSHALVKTKEKDNSFKVLMICSLRAYKGVFEYLHLAQKFESKCANVQFTLILNASELEVSSFFQQNILPNNVTILTKLADVTPYYQASDLLLNLSRPREWVETFGLTILEAMSHGLPVIVPPVGGPAEIVEDGVQGYLVDSGDTNCLIERINYLLVNPIEYDRLAINAVNRAKDFSLEVFNREIEGVFFD